MTSGMIVFIVSLAVLIGIPAIFAKITGDPSGFIIVFYLLIMAVALALLISCIFQMPVGS